MKQRAKIVGTKISISMNIIVATNTKLELNIGVRMHSMQIENSNLATKL